MMSDSREIDEQAALWFSRSQARRLTHAEQQQLAAWLQSAPAHAEAFRQMQQVWGDCALIPRPASAPQPEKTTSRWRPLRSCAAGLFFLFALLLPMSQLPLLLTNDIQLQTANHSREIVLSDGTRVHVNRHSQIRVHYAKENRQLWLDQGEIYLQVAANKTRPFMVYAGESQVRVVGTAFDVRFDAGEVAVAVKQGIVAMTGRPNMAAVMLYAGDRAQLLPEKKRLLLSKLPMAEIGEWRSGQLRFRNRPLGELLAELRRYRPGNIELLDASLAQLPISGSLDLNRPDEFLDSLPLLLAVNVTHGDKGNVLISRDLKNKK
ncbi:FecR family protein [Yersinia mollaretii]|uniref:FecR family protein n=1 Tax=Yersinia mollaretii TaxID=33060 RepID=UPI0005DF103C|nr:FecR domain-containing protein [Yersinia mollaretii]MDN0112151.1 FecR domain-containing protein [Yersinia mollaretii]PJE85956.1 histidine kinase [Yersinia mollaretii]CQD36992.1 putative two-component system sensor protein [Yersinia mollaretii]CQH36811.1 putative two-component system sensor protein [Yersinia mollaretii]